jgi:hypothetical protein
MQDNYSPGPYNPSMDLSPHQIAILERLAVQGFAVVAFPMYASAVGVRRGDCAALLIPAPEGRLLLQGEPCYLLNDNLAVPVLRGGKKVYVWKKQAVEATPEREAALKEFKDDVLRLLESHLSFPSHAM